MTRIKAIREYFSVEGHPVKIQELKELTEEDKDELGKGAAKELGVEITQA